MRVVELLTYFVKNKQIKWGSGGREMSKHGTTMQK